MKRQRHLMLVALTVIGGLLLFAGPVAARATKTAFEGVWTVSGMGEPEKWWFPGDRWQARGWPLYTGFHTGHNRVDGEWDFLFDNHFDSEGAGPWNGTFHGEVSCDGDEGAWEGTFTGESYGGGGQQGGTAYARGHGSGCVEGMKIFFDMFNDGEGTMSLEGYILDPHGE